MKKANRLSKLGNNLTKKLKELTKHFGRKVQKKVIQKTLQRMSNFRTFKL